MNALIFYAAAGLMLAGGLASGRLEGAWRRASFGTLIAGFLLLAAGLDAWPVFLVSLLFLPLLLSPFFPRRRTGSVSGEEVDVDIRSFETNAERERGKDKKKNGEDAVPALRKGIAALLCASLAGILLSVVWSNPLWKIRTPSEGELPLPGSGLILFGVLPALLLLFSLRTRKTAADDRGLSGDIDHVPGS